MESNVWRKCICLYFHYGDNPRPLLDTQSFFCTSLPYLTEFLVMHCSSCHLSLKNSIEVDIPSIVPSFAFSITPYSFHRHRVVLHYRSKYFSLSSILPQNMQTIWIASHPAPWLVSSSINSCSSLPGLVLVSASIIMTAFQLVWLSIRL